MREASGLPSARRPRHCRMIKPSLRPGISHRCFPGCAIILDIDRDRYWQVSEQVGATLDRVAQGEGRMLAPGEIAHLESLGLITYLDADSAPAPAIDLPDPTRSAAECDAPRTLFCPAEAAEVALLTLTARWLVRRRPLCRLLDGVVRRRVHALGSADPVALAQRFGRYRRLVPLASLCLPDTLAFLRFAARRGARANMVFGVEAWPFAAHCWAQAGECVLNDALDHARSFAPIRVL